MLSYPRIAITLTIPWIRVIARKVGWSSWIFSESSSVIELVLFVLFGCQIDTEHTIQENHWYLGTFDTDLEKRKRIECCTKWCKFRKSLIVDKKCLLV